MGEREGLAFHKTPYLTADLPGCGGILKSCADDFEVEEVPAYLPCGAGEHLFLWIEKVDRDTASVAQALAKTAGLSEREVSYAGLKDKRAVARQWFCVPAKAGDKLEGFSEAGIRILSRALHRNKLRTGHVRANRFKIRLREVRDAKGAQAVVDRLRSEGFPNFFGPQRFGLRGDNAQWGKRLLLKQSLPQRMGRFHKKLYLSAFQSLLFNRALAQRISARTFARALEGDVLKKLDSGGAFVCRAPEEDQRRVDAFEISPTGPLFGPRMMPAEGEVGEFEARLLSEEGVDEKALTVGGDELQGARRAFRLPFAPLDFVISGADVLLSFELPAGSYATIVLREVMKSPSEGTGPMDTLGAS